MGAYGVGNIVSNFVVGSVPIRRPAMVMIVAQFVLGGGFAVVAVAHTLPVALAGIALAAVGGPMGDIPLATMLQRDFPRNQVGKVFSLRFTLSNIGLGLGLILAGPLFALLQPGIGIGLCALVMAAAGVSGIVRFHQAANAVWENRQDAKAQRTGT